MWTIDTWTRAEQQPADDRQDRRDVVETDIGQCGQAFEIEQWREREVVDDEGHRYSDEPRDENELNDYRRRTD